MRQQRTSLWTYCNIPNHSFMHKHTGCVYSTVSPTVYRTSCIVISDKQKSLVRKDTLFLGFCVAVGQWKRTSSRVCSFIHVYICIYIYIYLLRSFKASHDAFWLSYSIAFDCSIRPFLDLFHSWLYIFHLSRFSGDGLLKEGNNDAVPKSSQLIQINQTTT